MEDPIVKEIHEIRERMAKECGYDSKKMYERIKAGEERLRKQGWKFYEKKPKQKAV